jgi:hypothetical protein
MPDANQLRVAIVVDASQLNSAMPAAAAAVTSAADQMAVALATVSPAATKMAASLKTAGMSSADAASAMKNLGFSAREITAALGETNVALNETGPAAERAATGVNNARAAMMGLNRELGLGGNRALSTFIQQSEMLGPILNKAFTGIAIVGFIQLAILAGDKLSELITKTWIFTDAQKALAGELQADNQKAVAQLAERQRLERDLQLVGKSRAEQERMSAQWAKEDAAGINSQLQTQLQALAAATAKANQERTARDQLQAQLAIIDTMANTNEKELAIRKQGLTMGAADSNVEAADQAVQRLSASVRDLRAQFGNAALAAEGMARKAGIEATKEAEKAAKEQERLEKQKEAETHRRIIAELNDEERLAKERIKIAEFDAETTKEFNKNIEQEEKKIDAQILADKKFVLEEIVKAQERYLKTQERLAKEAAKPWAEMFKSITSGMDSMIKGILQGTQSLTQAFSRLGTDLLVIMTEALGKILLKHIAHWIAVHIIEKSAALQSLATLITGNAAKQAATSVTNVATVTSEAAVAGAAGFASAMLALPFPINVSVAPGVGAAAFATGMAYAPIASAAGGWNIVPADNTLAILHKDEKVLTAGEASLVRNFTGSGGQGGGEIHIHMGDVHAIDARGVADVLRGQADTIASIIQQHQREFKI